jgi:AcrR family transcriptional regulator
MPRLKGARDADYEIKRAVLLERMTVRMMRREIARPSLRQLAEAAGVTVPTLRHYFGSRAEVVRAILAGYRQAGEQRLQAITEPTGDLEQSVRDYARSLIAAVEAPRPVKLGDVFAVSLAEGLLDEEIGPSTLANILDPSVDVLKARLEKHVARGEMVATDTHAAAVLLISPLLIAALHQFHMGGRACSPVDLDAMADEICSAFVRAYALAALTPRAPVEAARSASL